MLGCNLFTWFVMRVHFTAVQFSSTVCCIYYEKIKLEFKKKCHIPSINENKKYPNYNTINVIWASFAISQKAITLKYTAPQSTIVPIPIYTSLWTIQQFKFSRNTLYSWGIGYGFLMEMPFLSLLSNWYTMLYNSMLLIESYIYNQIKQKKLRCSGKNLDSDAPEIANPNNVYYSRTMFHDIYIHLCGIGDTLPSSYNNMLPWLLCRMFKYVVVHYKYR